MATGSDNVRPHVISDTDARVLRRFRDALKISQESLAAYLGYTSNGDISALEKPGNPRTHESLLKRMHGEVPEETPGFPAYNARKFWAECAADPSADPADEERYGRLPAALWRASLPKKAPSGHPSRRTRAPDAAPMSDDDLKVAISNWADRAFPGDEGAVQREKVKHELLNSPIVNVWVTTLVGQMLQEIERLRAATKRSH